MRTVAKVAARQVSTVLAAAALATCDRPPPPEPAFRDYTVQAVTVGIAPDGEEVAVAVVGPDFFSSFPEAVVVLGRSLVGDDFHAAAAPVVVLDHNYWRDRIGADEGVLGRQIVLNGVGHTVVGLLGGSVVGPEGAALYVPRNGVRDALGSCGDDLALRAGSVIEEVRGRSPLHLVLYRRTRADAEVEYAAVVALPEGGCRTERLDLRSRNDGWYGTTGVSATGVPVLEFNWDLGGTDGPAGGQTYLVQRGGRTELVGSWSPLRFLPGDTLLFGPDQLLDPESRRAVSLDTLGSGRVFEVFALNATSVLVTRCLDPLCGGHAPDGSGPGGWGQIVSWHQGVLAEFPFHGFQVTELNPIVLVEESDAFIALLDHRSNLLTVVPREGSAPHVQHPVGDLPAALETDVEPTVLFEYAVFDPYGAPYGVIRHEFFFTSVRELPRYRLVEESAG